MSVFIGFGFNLKWQNELFLKPLSLVGRPNSLQHGRKQAEAFLGTQCWDPSIPSSLLCPAQLCVCYARRCFLSKLLSFHHFDGLSMSVDVGYVRTSLPLTADMTLKGEEECLWGKRCWNFCHGCRTTYVAVLWSCLRQRWTFCWGLCFPDILFQILIILRCFWNQAKLPDWVKQSPLG